MREEVVEEEEEVGEIFSAGGRANPLSSSLPSYPPPPSLTSTSSHTLCLSQTDHPLRRKMLYPPLQLSSSRLRLLFGCIALLAICPLTLYRALAKFLPFLSFCALRRVFSFPPRVFALSASAPLFHSWGQAMCCFVLHCTRHERSPVGENKARGWFGASEVKHLRKRGGERGGWRGKEGGSERECQE